MDIQWMYLVSMIPIALLWLAGYLFVFWFIPLMLNQGVDEDYPRAVITTHVLIIGVSLLIWFSCWSYIYRHSLSPDKAKIVIMER